MNRTAITLLASLVITGCEGVFGGPTGGGGGEGGGTGTSGGGAAGGGGGSSGGGLGGGAGGGVGDGGVPTTADVFARLSYTCAGCHTVTTRPYFESLTSFENLLVFNTTWVTPGNPNTSALLRLLDGTGPKPMPPPPSGHFTALEAAGLTLITFVELEAWIRALPPRMPSPLDRPHLRRKGADQIIRALRDQLGLTDAELYSSYLAPTAIPGTAPVISGRSTGHYAARSPQLLPPNDPNSDATALHTLLGGGQPLAGQPAHELITGGFAVSFTHLSQAWCRLAVTKPNNTVFFTSATATQTSAAPAAIKANISDLYLRMLGEAPSQAEVDDLFAIFVRYEPNGVPTAWTGVCAALVRDPLWIFY